MSQTAVIHARIDAETKATTEGILETLGMTPTEAIRLFYRQIALRRDFPLELQIPNKLTAATLTKSQKNKEIESFDSTRDLYSSWEQ